MAECVDEELEANELLDETQRLQHKRDLLTKENEQLKSYLRLRQVESTATCEQLKSEIEQQIEQFEALGDTQTNHLETLKSFRSEIEAIQCWNAKIRNKYFSRHNQFGADGEPSGLAGIQITDEMIEEMVRSGASGSAHEDSTACDNDLSEDLVNICEQKDTKADNEETKPLEKPMKKPIKRKTNTKSNSNENSDKSETDLVVETNSNPNNYNIITRSKQKSSNTSTDNKRKQIDKNGDKSRIMSKRKRN